MRDQERFGWVCVLFLCALGLAMAVSTLAHASLPSLTERLVTAQSLLQSKTEEPVDALELAEAVAAVPNITREWAALLLTVAGHESALSRRIADGRCRPRECDGGLAFGLYQNHQNAFNAGTWGSTDVRVQTKDAAAMLRRAFYTCQHGPPLRPDWVARTINAYAGRPCDAIWPGLAMRLATYRRLAARL